MSLHPALKDRSNVLRNKLRGRAGILPERARVTLIPCVRTFCELLFQLHYTAVFLEQCLSLEVKLELKGSPHLRMHHHCLWLSHEV